MLKALQIKNYVLIDSLDVSFPAGLSIITGQTGAGKSILLGAISLVLGSKADVSDIGGDGQSCVVEAVFALPDDSPARSVLDGNDLDWNEGNLVIRRVVSRSGRSRAFINDCPASVQTLSLISPYLMDIHSQHQNLLLKDKRFALSMLDSYAGNGDLLSSCESTWASLQKARATLNSVKADYSAASASMDYNAAMLSELVKADLKQGELESLEAEHRQLSNAEEIKNGLFQVEQMLSPDDDEREAPSAILRESVKTLSKLSSYLPAAKELSSRLESIRVDLEDVAGEVSSLESGIDLSTERLSSVEDRMSLLYGLMKKHSCRDIDELISVRDTLSKSENDLSSMKEKIDALEKEISSLAKEYESISSSLHERRVLSSSSFASEIESSLRFLELDRCVFAAEVTPAPDSASGRDCVTLLFSATGGNLSDVSKIASGGEMSRIMLCLKALRSKYSSMPTLFFDEIDTGVSGSAADKMGTMICDMGKSMQIFAITHLPQVAAKGKAHYLVSKTTDEVSGKTVSTIEKITGKDRVLEIARMLSGSTITPEAVANAKALLASA